MRRRDRPGTHRVGEHVLQVSADGIRVADALAREILRSDGPFFLSRPAAPSGGGDRSNRAVTTSSA